MGCVPTTTVKPYFAGMKSRKCSIKGTGWISYNHARRKMNDLCSILLHLFRSRFHVSAGAAITGGKSYELDLVVLVRAERPLPAG